MPAKRRFKPGELETLARGCANRDELAKKLGISRSTLRHLLERYGVVLTWMPPRRTVKVTNAELLQAFEDYGPNMSEVARQVGLAHETARTRLKGLGVTKASEEPPPKPELDAYGQALAAAGGRFTDVTFSPKKDNSVIDRRKRASA